MTFTVKYRANDGSVIEEIIEATDRGDCFNKCKSHGFVPMNVKEGNGKVKSRGAKGSKANVPKIKLIIASGILFAGVAVWFCVELDTTKPEKIQAKQAAEINEKTTKLKTDKATKKSPTSKDTDKLVLREENEKKTTYDPNFQTNYPRKPGHLPLPGGNVITFKPPAPGCTAQVYTVNGLYLCDSEGNFTKYEPPRLFDNRFENTLDNLAMNTQVLLTDHAKNFTAEEIDKYLSRPITITADDPPEIVTRKTATAAMKEEIREFIKNGGTYSEYIDSLHNKIGTERILHREAMREMVALLSEGDYEGAREYQKKIDSFLSESGYFGLKLPEEWQQQLQKRTISKKEEQ